MTTTTTLDSSSLAESTSMDDATTTTTTTNRRFRSKTTAAAITSGSGSADRRYGGVGGSVTGRIGEGRGNRNIGDDDEAGSEGDVEVWSTFSESFKQVQTVLDRNRTLIQQVNENHRSKISDNLVKNVALIQEINSNISRVVSLYSDLSSDFSSMFHQRKESASNNDDEQFGSR